MSRCLVNTSAKKVLLLIIAVTAHFYSFGQWVKLNSGVASQLKDVFFLNSSTGFVVGAPIISGQQGLLLKTIDGGQTWTTISTGVKATFNSIWFTDNNTGYISNDAGSLLKTFDQGATWNIIFTNSGNVPKIIFANSLVGYAILDKGIGNYLIIKTTDGGNHWAIVSQHQWKIYGLDVLSPDTVFMSVFDDPNLSGEIWASYNGGSSWNLLQSGDFDPSCIKALSKLNILEGTYDSFIYTTTDGGISWDTHSVPGTVYNDMAFVSDVTGWMAGENIVKTTDDGNSWTVEVPFSYNRFFRSIKFPSGDTGFAVGDSGIIYKYTTPSTQSILTAPFPENTFCPGQSLTVGYTAYGTFGSGNIFTAQLSDETGSFATPVNIGSISVTTSGFISCVVPPLTASGSTYRIRVVSSEPAVTGSDNGSNFSITCPVPTGLHVTNIKSTTAKLIWTPIQCSQGYQVRYRKTGTTVWTKVNTSVTLNVIHGLSPATSYQWSAQNKCVITPKITSPFAANQTFTTDPMKWSEENEESVEMKIFPNPVSENITVEFDNEFNGEPVRILITDILGRIVFVSEKAIDGNSFSLPLDEKITNGIYLFTIQSAQTTQQKFFEVQK